MIATSIVAIIMNVVNVNGIDYYFHVAIIFPKIQISA
jgi:hypothetical protein